MTTFEQAKMLLANCHRHQLAELKTVKVWWVDPRTGDNVGSAHEGRDDLSVSVQGVKFEGEEAQFLLALGRTKAKHKYDNAEAEAKLSPFNKGKLGTIGDLIKARSKRSE